MLRNHEEGHCVFIYTSKKEGDSVNRAVTLMTIVENVVYINDKNSPSHYSFSFLLNSRRILFFSLQQKIVGGWMDGWMD